MIDVHVHVMVRSLNKHSKVKFPVAHTRSRLFPPMSLSAGVRGADKLCAVLVASLQKYIIMNWATRWLQTTLVPLAAQATAERGQLVGERPPVGTPERTSGW